MTPAFPEPTRRPASGAGLDPSRTPERSRREFLRLSAAMGGVIVFAAACRDGTPMEPAPDVASLGSGNVAVLNYALLLEQLEAAFYVQVTQQFYAGASMEERAILSDLRDHEVAHRDFLFGALGSAALPEIEFDFSGVNFGSRASVLTTARTFEDLGVSAYNGAGRLFSTDAEGATLLTVAGKIVSVEARHAAAIRTLLGGSPRDFAGDDVVDANGLDVLRRPPEVLAAAAPFVVTEIDVSGLPSA